MKTKIIKRKINDYEVSLKEWDNKITVKDKSGKIIEEMVFSDYIKASITLKAL